MKLRTITLFLGLAVLANGQLRVPKFPAADEKITTEQAQDFFRVVRAVTGNASKVVFPVYSFRRPVGSAVSLGDDLLLAKLSELAGKPRLVTFSKGKGVLPLKIIGAYPEHDLAVVYCEGLEAPAAKWSDGSALPEGSLLAAVRHDGEAQGIGVKSVAARSLRNEDQGFLGVSLDPRQRGKGVVVQEVPPRTAAAEVGLRRDDVILSVNGKEVRSYLELSNLLKRLRVGEQPEIVFNRGEETLSVTPTLRGNPQKDRESKRLEMMDTYSGGRNGVHDGFPNVIQSDMELDVNSTGLPVVDLNGKMIGMVIARAGRISTLILPGELILEVLKEKPLTDSQDPDHDMIDGLLAKLQKRFSE